MSPASALSRHRPAAGFTLIEILIVVAIIGIIAAIAIPNLLTAMDRARQASTATLLRAFGIALEAYNAEFQRYPVAVNSAELLPLLSPYSDTLRSQDEWHHLLGYETDGSGYTIQSFGKDGIDGLDVSPATRFEFTLDLVYSDGIFTAGIE